MRERFIYLCNWAEIKEEQADNNSCNLIPPVGSTLTFCVLCGNLILSEQQAANTQDFLKLYLEAMSLWHKQKK